MQAAGEGSNGSSPCGACKHVVKRGAALFCGALRQAHQIFGRKMPCRRRKHAGASDVVIGKRNQAQIGKHVANEGMLENREPADHERNFSLRKLFDQKIPVGVLAVENGKVSPAAAGVVQAFEFVSDPSGFGFRGVDFHDADFFAFGRFGAGALSSGNSGLTSFMPMACVATRRMFGVER